MIQGNTDSTKLLAFYIFLFYILMTFHQKVDKGKMIMAHMKLKKHKQEVQGGGGYKLFYPLWIME